MNVQVPLWRGTVRVWNALGEQLNTPLVFNSYCPVHIWQQEDILCLMLITTAKPTEVPFTLQE